MATPVTYNPYVSQYVPAPIQEFQQTAAHFQQEYDENLLASEKLRTMMGSIKAATPAHKVALAQELKQYENQIAGIAKQGNWEDAALKVRNLATDFGQNYQAGNIGTINSTYQNMQLRNAEKAKLGNEYADYNDDWLTFQRRGGVDKTGQLQGYSFTGLGKQENHQKRADEMMAHIADSGSLQGYFTKGEDGIVHIKEGYEGVAGKVVRQLAHNKASDFLGTVEGKDFARMMASQYRGRVDPKDFNKTLMGAAEDYLYNSGSNQIGVKTTRDAQFRYDPEYINRQKSIAHAMHEGDEGFAGGSDNLAQHEDLANIDVNDIDKDGQLAAIKNGGGGIMGGDAHFNVNMTYEQREQAKIAANGIAGDQNNLIASNKAKSQQKLLDDAYSFAGQHAADTKDEAWAKMSKQERYKMIVANWQNNKTVTPSYFSLGDASMSSHAKRTVKDKNLALLRGREITVVGEDGTERMGTVDKAMAKYNLSPKNIQAIVPVGISKDDPYGAIGGEVLQVTTKDTGKMYTLYTSANSKSARALYANTKSLIAAARSGLPQTHADASPTTQYNVRNIPTSSGKYVTQVQTLRYDVDEHGNRRNLVRQSDFEDLDKVLDRQHKGRLPALEQIANQNLYNNNDVTSDDAKKYDHKIDKSDDEEAPD